MNRLAIPLSILALTSAGCAMSVREPNIIPPSPAIQPQTTGFRTGTGVVQSVAVAPARMGAAAGASASTNRPGPLAEGRVMRLGIKMDRGNDTQYVDTDSADFRTGMRVELTPDGKIRQL